MALVLHAKCDAICSGWQETLPETVPQVILAVGRVGNYELETMHGRFTYFESKV